jgi:transglutaminase-like putative cysteine protease
MTAIARNTAGLSRLVWTAGIVLGASLPHWTSLPAWIPTLLCAAVAWRFAARVLSWPLPGPWLQRILTVLALGAVLVEFRTINGLTPGTALLVVMVALKFLEGKSQRDHLILTVIAYFLGFASLLTDGGLFKGVYLLAFVWITTLGLLQVGRQGPLLANAPTAKLAARLLLQSVPLMVVLFLLFPRLPGPLWALPGDTSSGVTGLAGSMSPGDITELGLSDEVAFRVDFSSQAPAASELYWRGPVLSDFDGRSWTMRPGWGNDPRASIEYLGETSEYEVTLEPNERGWLFAIELPERWVSDSRRRPIGMAGDYRLRRFDEAGGLERMRYTVTSHSRYRAMEPLTDGQIESFKQLPPDGNPRTRELVANLTADSPSADVIIERALDVFRADDFYYTLTPPPLGRHTADDFIFETREGFCEHYASAFAIMLRMAGLPARVVTGYQGGEFNGIGDYYIIRQSDAHAWTEVWTAEAGWMRVDPIGAVAPERISLGSTRTTAAAGAGSGRGAQLRRSMLVRQAMLAWDAVNAYWDAWVIGYGPRLQSSLFEWLGFERPRWRELLLLTTAATVAMMVLLSLYLGWRFRLERAKDPAARDFERFKRRLKRLDVAPARPGETPRSYAERAKARLPGLAPYISAVTEAYLRARYEPDPNGLARERLGRLVRDFRRSYAPASR